MINYRYFVIDYIYDITQHYQIMRMVMNLRTLQYLVAIDRCKHFSKAAEACFVSQPTLSMQIKKFESWLGVELIERSHKKILLTELGINIVSRAKQIIQLMDDIKITADLYKNPLATTLKLGVIPTLAPYLLPVIMPALNQQFPQLKLHLFELQTLTLLQRLKDGELDAALMALPVNDDQFNVHTLFNENFYLAVSNKHAWAKLKSINQNQLKNKSLLLLEEGHCLRDQALDVCEHAYAKESQQLQATSLETLRHMVAANIGITLIPELACQQHKTAINYIPFTDPKPTRKIAMVWRKTSVHSELIRQLNDQIGKIM